jgi:hypothetical protein
MHAMLLAYIRSFGSLVDVVDTHFSFSVTFFWVA